MLPIVRSISLFVVVTVLESMVLNIAKVLLIVLHVLILGILILMTVLCVIGMVFPVVNMRVEIEVKTLKRKSGFLPFLAFGLLRLLLLYPLRLLRSAYYRKRG